MFATKNLQKRCFQTLTSRFITNSSRDVQLLRDAIPNFKPRYAAQSKFAIRDDYFLSSIRPLNCFDGHRTFSTSKSRSMRSKMEMRMKKESGKTLREIRRIRYLYKEDYDGRYTKPGMGRMAPQRGGNSEDDEDEIDSDNTSSFNNVPKVERWNGGKHGRPGNGGRFNRRDEEEDGEEEEESEPEDMLNDLENVMFETDEENESRSASEARNHENEIKAKTIKNLDKDWDSE